jgi:hypothetical protein
MCYRHSVTTVPHASAVIDILLDSNKMSGGIHVGVNAEREFVILRDLKMKFWEKLRHQLQKLHYRKIEIIFYPKSPPYCQSVIAQTQPRTGLRDIAQQL